MQLQGASQSKMSGAKGEMDIDDDGEFKKRRTMCLNLVGKDFEKSGGDRMMEAYEMSIPMLVVTGSQVEESVRNAIWKQQAEHMSYVVHIAGIRITTNSTQVVAQLQNKGMIEDAKTDDKESCEIRLRQGVQADELGEELAHAFEEQAKVDRPNMFLCGVESGVVHSEELESAVQGERQCHEQDVHMDDEAWDDVNDCRLDPVKVRAARQAEMEYFRKMKV